MGDRYEEAPGEETAVTEVRREPPEGPPPGEEPPWWRENWWIWLIVLLLLVAALIGFFALRDRDDDEEAAPEQVTVPHVIGLDEAEARQTLAQQELEADVAGEEESAEPEGTVIAQRPETGTQVAPGSTVELILSAGEPEEAAEEEPPAEEEPAEEEPAEEEPPEGQDPPEEPPQVVGVPEVVGAAHVQAADTVEQLGLIANTFPVQSQEERGTVVAQNPGGGTELTEGQTVRLNVSLGTAERDEAEIPDVTGEEEADARRMLRQAGFTVRTLDRQAPEPRHVGVVILQQPAPRTAPVLTQVTIYVGRQG